MQFIHKKITLFATLLTLSLSLCLAFTGCKKGSMEKAGEEMDEAIENVEQNAEDAVEKVEDTIE